MSDIDEPPTKMSKYEEYLDPECEEECLEEEGQEEWLSEGVLTDDDYVQTTEHDHDQDKSDTILPTHQEDNENNQSLEEDTDIIQTTTVIGQVELHNGSITNATITHGTIAHSNSNLGSVTHGMDNVNENIEEQLNNLENTQNGDELSDDLDAFLISKADGRVVEAKVTSETDLLKMKTHEDDGNDTDDLLRMLGEGDQKVKKKTFKMVKSDKNDDQGSSDDDDFIYERSQVKTLKLAKNALIKRTATKAVPEDMSDGDDENDQSSDEGHTVERIFEMKKPPPASGKKPQPKGAVKHVVRVNNKSKKPEQKYKPMFTTQKSNKKSATPTAIQKPQKSEEGKTPTPIKAPEKWTTKEKVLPVVEDSSVVASRNEEFDEIIDGEEFLEQDVTDLDEEEFDEYSEGEGSRKQEIMKPEMMDEEVPSDAETQSEDGSLYDELPSSDSEDLDDWFTLDIRAERAGDYLPLLGIKARDLLIAERRRVSAKVDALRQSLSALTESARRQADQLRSAAMALAEIDDTLRAA